MQSFHKKHINDDHSKIVYQNKSSPNNQRPLEVFMRNKIEYFNLNFI